MNWYGTVQIEVKIPVAVKVDGIEALYPDGVKEHACIMAREFIQEALDRSVQSSLVKIGRVTAAVVKPVQDIEP